MPELIEVTCVYDSGCSRVSTLHPAKMLLDPDSVAAVLECDGSAEEGNCRVELRPGVAGYLEDEGAGPGHRTVYIRESYSQLRAVLATLRGIIEP